MESPNFLRLFDQDPSAFKVAAGQPVFREGDSADRMFAVIEGSVEIYVHGKLMETVGPGGVFGEMALIEHRPRNATVLAKDDVKLTPVDEKRFLFLVQQHPFFALRLMAVMSERLRGLDALIS